MPRRVVRLSASMIRRARSSSTLNGCPRLQRVSCRSCRPVSKLESTGRNSQPPPRRGGRGVLNWPRGVSTGLDSAANPHRAPARRTGALWRMSASKRSRLSSLRAPCAQAGAAVDEIAAKNSSGSNKLVLPMSGEERFASGRPPVVWTGDLPCKFLKTGC
jgi:hypothetical protein